MLKLLFSKTTNYLTYSLILSSMLSGCAPLVPDNYLSPNTMRTPQKVNGKWVSPRIIPVNVQMLHTVEGQELLAPALQPKPYRIGTYDHLNIIVWGHPELSTLATAPAPTVNASTGANTLMTGVTNNSSNNPVISVQIDGTIFFPYVGRLKVEGLTLDETQEAITARLSRYVKNPQVTVQVSKFRNRNAFVLGEVKAPGMQPLTDKPLSLMEAISSAGGIDTNSADPSHIYLIRGSFEKPDIYLLNGQTPQSLMIAQQFPLQENDIVYVSAAVFNSWNHFVSTVFPTFTTYYTIKGLAR